MYYDRAHNTSFEFIPQSHTPLVWASFSLQLPIYTVNTKVLTARLLIPFHVFYSSSSHHFDPEVLKWICWIKLDHLKRTSCWCHNFCTLAFHQFSSCTSHKTWLFSVKIQSYIQQTMLTPSQKKKKICGGLAYCVTLTKPQYQYSKKEKTRSGTPWTHKGSMCWKPLNCLDIKVVH